MTRIALGILIAVLIVVALTSCTIETTGSPTGKSVRVGDTVVTMMSRLEPYVPTLNRDHSKDVYTIGLLIHSARDTAVREFVEIVRGQRPADITLMNIIAVDGNVVWYRAENVGAYDISQRKFVYEEPVRAPVSRIPKNRFSGAEMAIDERAILSMLMAGGEPTPTRWLGVLTEEEAAKVWSAGSSILASMPIERSKIPRQLYVTNTTRGGDGGARIERLAPVGSDSMLNAAFVRAIRWGEILRLSGDGFLMLYESKSFRGTIMAARVDGAGKLVWKIDTGIGELREILPDSKLPALIGWRAAMPDSVPEPILLVMDAASGNVSTRSLWMK